MFPRRHSSTHRANRIFWLAMGFSLAASLAGAASLYGQAPNPVPLIDQPLVPTSTAPGGVDFPLTVNGTGFVSGATVDWNGSPRTTNFVNGSQLTATITAADIATAGTASVTVFNPTPGGGTSNLAFFHVTNPLTSVLMSRTDYAAVAWPASVATQDFNGDGQLDLAVTNVDGNTVSILLGNGDGTFQTQTTFATGVRPYSVTTGDFNGDGKLDLAVTSVDGNTVSILLGNGDGSFQAQTTFATGAGAFSVTTGDFNGDGKLDLAVANYSGNTVSILLGNGDGTFQTQTPFATGFSPSSVTTGDFNGDGNLDLAVGNYSDSTVSILLGNGDGSFQTQSTFATGPYPNAMTTGDFNGDGRLDLAVTNGLVDTVSILLGNGDGTFQTQTPLATGLRPSSPTTGDFNGDGKLDLAVATAGYAEVSILLGNGDGSFQTQTPFATGSAGFSVTAGDFNGDGKLDLAVGNDVNMVSILLQTVGPVVQLAWVPPATGNFGNQLVLTQSAVQQITLTNAGNAPLTFSVGSFNVQLSRSVSTASPDFSANQNCTNTLDVQPGASCTINVFFYPQTTGAKTAVIKIIDNASDSPQFIDLTGTGTQPAVSLSQTSINFGSLFVGSISTPSVLVTLTNTGTAPLIFSPTGLTGANPGAFNDNNGCIGTIQPGFNCFIDLRFEPNALGSLSAQIDIISNAPTSGLDIISLSGIGVAPPVPILTSPGGAGVPVTFPATNVGATSASQTVTLKNNATDPQSAMTITSITTDGNINATDLTFRIDPASPCLTVGTLAAGATCDVNLTFHPYQLGTVNGHLIVNDNAPGSPHSLVLSGTGNPAPFARGEVFISAGGQIQRRSATGNLIQLLSTGFTYVTGMAFDVANNLYVTGVTSNVIKFDSSGNPLGNFVADLNTAENILFDATGNAYIGDVGGTSGSGIHKYDSTGTPITTFLPGVQVDWMDLAADQKTMLFTQEGQAIHTVDVTTGVQGLDFATGLGGNAFALRILRDGTVLVANGPNILHLNSSGAVIQTYTVAGETFWFALNLDPDGTSFWSADASTSHVYKFDIASGNLLLNPPESPYINAGTPNGTWGLVVNGEITAATSPQITLSASSVNFPGNPVGVNCPIKPVTITNNGPGDLLISSLSGISAPFTIDPATTGTTCLVNTPLASGQSCVINFKFLPTATGTLSQTLTITSNATTSPDTVQASGTGTPACALVAKAHTATVLRGTDTQDFAIEDAKPSCSPVNINLTCSAANPVACALAPAVIAPGGASTLKVANLKALGADSVSVRVDATSEFRTAWETMTVFVSDFAFTHAPDTASVVAGETASYSLALRPVNGLAGNVTLACSGAPRGASCAVTPSQITLDGASLSQVKVKVSTTARALALPNLPNLPLGFGGGSQRVVLLLLGLLAMLAVAASRRRGAGVAPPFRAVFAGLKPGATRLVLAAAMLAVLLWASCGGGGGSMNFSNGTPAGAYTLTVTGTYANSTGSTPGTLVNTTTVMLHVN